ncbi:MAG: VOC family protein [Alphaproteobacteria bacterium]|nr:VOC family protein [Alphaproteobacteria bacterium]
MSGWYARAVLHVADVARSLDFYVGRLGFAETWRHQDDGRPLAAQVDREGCELILSGQWPEGRGHGLIFVSLTSEDLAAAQAELAAKGVAMQEGWWGYKLTIVEDPDGNRLFFPHAGTE